MQVAAAVATTEAKASDLIENGMVIIVRRVFPGTLLESVVVVRSKEAIR